MKAAENGAASYFVTPRTIMPIRALWWGRTQWRRYRWSKMPAVIVMRYLRSQNELEMAFMERNQKIQPLATQAPAIAFAHRIRFRRSQYAYTHAGYLLVQFLGEDVIPVVNHKSIGMLAR